MHALSIVLALLSSASAAWAQTPPSTPPLPPAPIERPADRELMRPLPPPLERTAPPVLPPLPEPTLGEIQGDAQDDAVRVDAVELEGNTVIETATLEAAVAPFLGRRLNAEGIEALRRRLTQVYVAAGYVTSGALIPAQDLRDGRLRVRIVEGALAEIRFSGLEHYRPQVLRARLARDIEAPLDIGDVERAIRILDQDPRIERINARLRPGTSRGEAILEVAILEREPRQLELGYDNLESPAVGAHAGRLRAGTTNAFGFGDSFATALTRTEGLTRVSAYYELPLGAFGTRLVLDGGYGEAELVDDTLRRLEVGSTDATVSIGLAQTLWHTPSDRVDVSLAFERRRSKTTILGRGQSFVPGPQNGRSEVSAWRAAAEWTHRGIDTVFALRSLASFGTDWLNPTTQPGDTPDGVFVSWYAQARGVHRFPRSGIELALRADLQLSDRPLLSLEQFSLGGPESVRGYRRNQLVRDQGVAAAIELRVPLWRAADARPILELTPFYDLGYAWNHGRPTPPTRTLSGVGAGLAWHPWPWLDLEVEYAHGFRNLGDSSDLQDESVYLRAVWRAF